MVVIPTISMQSAMSRVLLNISANAPSTGWMDEGKVKPVESNAAVVGVTFKPWAICGMTGSTERMNSVVAKMTNAMRLRTRPMKLEQYAVQRLASRSNSTSTRSSNSSSFNGIMLGPSDGALSGS